MRTFPLAALLNLSHGVGEAADRRKEEIEKERGGEGKLINKNNGVLYGLLSRLAAHNRFHRAAGVVKPRQVCVRARVCLGRYTTELFPKSGHLAWKVNRSDSDSEIPVIRLASLQHGAFLISFNFPRTQ